MTRLALLLTTLTLAAAAPAAQAAERHTTPSGSGADCTLAAPCAITTAFADGSAGDEIVIHAGSYTVADQLFDNWRGYHVYGAPGEARPRIASSSDGAGIWLGGDGSTLERVDIHWTGENGYAALVRGPLVDRVSAHGVNGSGLRVEPGAAVTTITNSEISTAAEGHAAMTFLGTFFGVPAATWDLVVRNVTAVGTATGTIGLGVHANGINEATAAVTVNATNSILRGEEHDVGANAPAGDAAIVNLDHSNFAVTVTGGTGTRSITDPATADNQAAEPLLVDAAAGDLHQQASSPTRNAGVTDAANGPLDAEGDPRVVDDATDIGGDEYVQPPAPEDPDGGGDGSGGGGSGGGGAQLQDPGTPVDPTGLPGAPIAAAPIAAPSAVAPCVVPRLKGKTLRAAKVALLKAGCRPGKVSTRRARRAGRVIRQRIASGRRVARGTRVALVVGRRAR